MSIWTETSVRGMLLRAALAWVLVTPAIAAARIWASPLAAALTGVAGVALYVAALRVYRRRHPHPGERPQRDDAR